MREIRCADGNRWNIVLVAESGGAAPDVPHIRGGRRENVAEDDAAVVLLRCSTCEGEERHVTVRSPHHDWMQMSSEELCRLITAAQASGTASA